MTKRHSRSRRRKETPGWLWMTLGLTMGLIVAGYVYLSDVRAPSTAAAPPQARTPAPQTAETKPGIAASKPEPQASAAARSPAPAQTSTAQTSPARPQAAGPSTAQTPVAQTPAALPPPAAQNAGARFQFYENLPQSEVVIPEPSASTTAAATTAVSSPAARAPAPAAIEAGSYMLQVGSFRTHADADRRKASIALLGYESQIQQATVNGGVVHRVLVGPLTDLAALDSARRRFSEQNFDTLVLKAAN